MKKSIFVLILLLTSCVTEVIDPVPPPDTIKSIFSLKENSITNGQDIHFDLPLEGMYTLTLIDKESGQVVSREKFKGVSGENVKKIYTNSLEKRYLYLVLHDENKTELNKTKLVLK